MWWSCDQQMNMKNEKSHKMDYREVYMLHRLDIQRLSGKKTGMWLRTCRLVIVACQLCSKPPSKNIWSQCHHDTGKCVFRVSTLYQCKYHLCSYLLMEGWFDRRWWRWRMFGSCVLVMYREQVTQVWQTQVECANQSCDSSAGLSCDHHVITTCGMVCTSHVL